MDRENFESILNASMDNLKMDFKSGDKVTGTISSIDKKTIFVDIKAMSEGIINREEFLTDGELSIKVGDEIEAYYIDSTDEGIFLTVKMSGDTMDKHLLDAYSSGIPVEGKVLKEQKGGYIVKVGSSEAFCPYSQMSLNRESADKLIGNSYAFHVQEMKSSNLVVSRRKILLDEQEQEKESLRESLQVGDIVTGTVRKILDFGVFVNLGPVDGLIPMSELSWKRGVKADSILSEGDEVRVAIKALNWKTEKITLSFKSASTPWSDIESKYALGNISTATVVKLEAFGAFVELENEIEGLVHISKLGIKKRINHAKEAVSIGEKILVKVIKMDSDKHQIGLEKVREDEDEEIVENTPQQKFERNKSDNNPKFKKQSGFGSLSNLFDGL